MSDNNNWKYELEEYLTQVEPDQKEKSEAWATAIGLQDVDGLQTSKYLIETAKDHIEGKIDIKTAQQRIHSYYEEKDVRTEKENETKEADEVSARITEILQEKTFNFSPAEWQELHRRIFEGIFSYAGQIRTVNITKNEWVLNGDTVTYTAYGSIKATMDYDFNTEREFSYEGLSIRESVKHIASFTSNIWQIHPFREGNTRATAVFILKYLKTFGFQIDNTLFAENSWYFRNALVRANYNNLQKGILATTEYLEYFFENLLLSSKNELKNRYLHVEYTKEASDAQTQSANSVSSKCQNGTLDDTLEISLEDLALLKIVNNNPYITQKEIAKLINDMSERTVKRRTVELQEKGFLKRMNGKRNGYWEVLVNIK